MNRENSQAPDLQRNIQGSHTVGIDSHHCIENPRTTSGGNNTAIEVHCASHDSLSRNPMDSSEPDTKDAPNTSLSPRNHKSWSPDWCSPETTLTDTPWDGDKRQIHPVPKYYPLESTHINISTDTISVKALIKKVSQAITAMSVQVKYSDSPVSACILTPDHVELFVALWEALSPQHEIVVEVQRRRGNSVRFQTYAHSILKAAQGGNDHDCNVNPTGDLDVDYLKAAENILRQHVNSKDTAKVKETCEGALGALNRLLQRNNMDSKLSGLVSLCLLANPRVSGIDASILISRAVLIQEDNKIRDYIFDILCHNHPGDSQDEPRSQLVLDQALQVLTSAIDVIANLSDPIEPYPGNHQDWNTILNDSRMEQVASTYEEFSALLDALELWSLLPQVRHCYRLHANFVALLGKQYGSYKTLKSSTSFMNDTDDTPDSRFLSRQASATHKDENKLAVEVLKDVLESVRRPHVKLLLTALQMQIQRIA